MQLSAVAELQLADVPPGTVSLQFQMTDLDKPGFHHGGGTVGYRGQPEVPCDAFSTGLSAPHHRPAKFTLTPSPSRRSPPDGTVLAATTARRKFPE